MLLDVSIAPSYIKFDLNGGIQYPLVKKIILFSFFVAFFFFFLEKALIFHRRYRSNGTNRDP